MDINQFNYKIIIYFVCIFQVEKTQSILTSHFFILYLTRAEYSQYQTPAILVSLQMKTPSRL